MGVLVCWRVGVLVCVGGRGRVGGHGVLVRLVRAWGTCTGMGGHGRTCTACMGMGGCRWACTACTGMGY